ncbi:hypothetical protein CEP53_004936 [Fusarium sp. AF-6]|nr:hypothetical protein CEP53_004936 [Fusarium sp. AF-6]
MMAISPPCHLGSEFPREAILNTTEDDNRWGLQSPVDQPPPPVIRCSIEKIAAKINSCAKARVLAIIAFNLLVFDGQLSKDRLNWACPFGHCKLGFVEKHELMEHILDCPDFSSDEVFCNCCTKDDRFQEHCRQNRAENIASHGNDKNSSKKRSRIRKLGSMFSRRGTESKSPPPSPGYPVSPVSTGRRASLPPLITPLPSPSNASRKVSSPASQVSCTEIFETPSPAQPETSRELIGSEPHIVPELQELATVEAPGELFGSTMMAQELPGAILNDMDFCESSTTADLPTYSMLHDQHAFRAGNTSLGQQIEASHVEPGPTNGLDSAFQPQGQHQPSWLVHLHLQQQQQQQQQQASWLDPGSQVSPANVQEALSSTGDCVSQSKSHWRSRGERFWGLCILRVLKCHHGT